MKNAKEKAEELVGKYKCYADGVDRQEDNDQIEEHLENAKQCALIAVDEILNLPVVWYDINASEALDKSDTFEYWEEVKSEIKKL
jgi:hypothetical protein